MAIQFDVSQTNEFFASEGVVEELGETFGKVLIYEYSAHLLKYVVMIHLDNEFVAISGDPVTPFGGDSLYEVSVPADHITVLTDEYCKERRYLAFSYGKESDPNHRTMSLRKKQDGELKVWTSYALSPEHPYGQTI